MSVLPNSRIKNLPLNPGLRAGCWCVVDNLDTGLTERFDVAEIFSSPITSDFSFLSDTAYSTGDIKVWKGLWYIAQQNVPANIVPGTDPLYWLLVPKSYSGFVFWQAGVFPYDESFVLKDLSTDPDNPNIQMFWLKNRTRPYLSSDFDTELAAGDWVQLFPSSAADSSEYLKNKGEWTDPTKYPDPTDLGYALIKNMYWVVATGAGITLNGNFWPDDTWLVVKTSNPGQDDTKWYRRA